MLTKTVESTNIDTLADMVPQLRALGYHAKLTDDGVITGVSITEDDGDEREFSVMITKPNEHFQIDCRLTTIGELDQKEDEVLNSLAWVLLAINAEIQPFAVALLNPDGVLDDTDILVLTDSVPVGDFCAEELAFAMDSLQRGLVAVVPAYLE